MPGQPITVVGLLALKRFRPLYGQPPELPVTAIKLSTKKIESSCLVEAVAEVRKVDEREAGCFGLGLLEILRLHLAKNEITIHPLIDFIEGNISAQVYVPPLYVPGTSILKTRYWIGN